MEFLLKSAFISHLIRINHLNHGRFARFIFFQGMLFGAKKKWWGKKGLRGSAHEGLDFCFFENTDHKKFRLDAGTAVPMLFDGQVANIIDDFLGKTVITRHCFDSSDQPDILSLYGHLETDPNLKIGDKLHEGQVFAKITGFKKKKNILPHLHLSLAKPERLPPAHCLEWEYLNTVEQSAFIDPLKAIAIDYTVIEYKDTWDIANRFPLWKNK